MVQFLRKVATVGLAVLLGLSSLFLPLTKNIETVAVAAETTDPGLEASQRTELIASEPVLKDLDDLGESVNYWLDRSINNFGAEYVTSTEWRYEPELTDEYEYYVYVFMWDTTFGLENWGVGSQIRLGQDDATSRLYDLEIVDTYDHLEYSVVNRSLIKFKVKEKAALHERLDPAVRVYHISELLIGYKNAYTQTEDCISVPEVEELTFTGVWNNKEDPLSGRETGDVTIQLDVKTTFWRHIAEGSNTAQEVDSVYFAIPNSYIDRYGDPVEVSYEYYYYRTTPMLILNDGKYSRREMYEYLQDYIGNIYDFGQNGSATFPYGFVWDYYKSEVWDFYRGGFNPHILTMPAGSYGLVNLDDELDRLVYVFIGEKGKDIHDVKIKGEEILEYIKTYDAKYTPDNPEKITVGGRTFSTDLFEDHTNAKYGYKQKTINAEDISTITVQGDRHFLDVFGWFTQDTTKEFAKLEEITQEVFNASDADDFLVDSDDYLEFSAYCAESYLFDRKPYLLRFNTSEYWATTPGQTTLCGTAEGLYGNTNRAYVAKAPVYLDFDIIEFTFEKNGVKTVIGVEMDPIDFVPDVEPGKSPSNPFGGVWNTLKKILGMILGIVLIVFLVWAVYKILILVGLFSNKKSRQPVKALARKKRRKRK